MDTPANEAGDPERSPKTLNFNGVAALLCIALGIVLFFITPYQVDKPLAVLGQSLNTLDPTLFPRIVAAGIFGVGVWYLFRSFSLTERNLFRDLDREAWINVGVSLVAFTLYALLMEPLGFVLSSILMVAGLSWFYGVRDWLPILLVSVGLPIVIYLTFTRLLQVFLPAFPEF